MGCKNSNMREPSLLRQTRLYDLGLIELFMMNFGLFDHTPIILSFPPCPKPKSSFQFCEMWAKDQGFNDIVKQSLAQQTRGSNLKALQHILITLRQPLRQLNRSKFADIYKQQTAARNKLLYKLICNRTSPTKNLSIKRDLYISINHSVMLLVKQQSKAEWISFGDECTRVFMVKMKQRKAWTSIYHINDQHDQRVEGHMESILHRVEHFAATRREGGLHHIYV
ncbi:LOW QUALITY PROTEIN: hypothetical protein Cgig2_018065 [Carnegiea gigantea]|uniref:Uncharacterized protein n=1 Tax=Carnegiea gigantea TaxID=171969 RepID=A0A9Q1GJL5_9CARY|nr:LOW QUALITY PROTEIN: hypothetical protein Cgig2_018065 [Carnegiea gigantea]